MKVKLESHNESHNSATHGCISHVVAFLALRQEN